MQKRRFSYFSITLLLIATLLGQAGLAAQDSIQVTDIAGRTVTVKKNIERVILGEGRMIYSIAVLDRENPFQRVVGWKDDLIKYDPDAYRRYSAKFPEAKDIANFGSPYAGDFSIESVIAKNADLVILNLGKLFDAEESGVLEKLEKAGIPVVFIDYRQRPTQNTVPSLMLLGRLFDRQERAQEFIDFYLQQMRLVTNRVSGIPTEDKPLVFIENAAGWYEDNGCCNTFGGANFGKFVDEAGGINWGTKKFPGYSSQVSLEAVLADDPDVVVGTGANWSEARPSTTAVLLGYEATPDKVNERLTALSQRKGWASTSAVKNKRFHSIYHQFYNSPYHFIALQALAKWFYPDDFADVDPEANFKTLHERFLPISFTGVFWAQLP